MKASIIVPAYNQAESLYLTLISFAHQCYDLSLFEVVVVNDGSEDGTYRTVSSYSAPYRLVHVEQSNQGRAVARNRGVREASGDILIFNDCDRAAGRDFVGAHLARQERHSGAVVVGSIYEFFFSDLSSRRDAIVEDIAQGFSRFGHLAREYPYAQAVSRMYGEDGTTDYHIPWISFFSGNVSLPKWAFEQVEGFDETFVGWGFEHFELGLRLYRAGFQYVYEPRARNFHFAHRREADFYRSNLRSSFEYLKAKHPEQEVELLGDFVRGNLSLQEYETLVGGNRSQGLSEEGPIYNTKPVDF